MTKYNKKVQKQLKQMKGEGTEIKIFRVLREENHKTNIVAKLTVFGIAEMLINVLVEMAEALCTKNVTVNAIEERED